MAHTLQLTEDDVLRLFRTAYERSYANYALLVTIYTLALRSSEATVIRRDEVNLSRQCVSVHVLKRSKTKRKDGVVIRGPKPPPVVDVSVEQELLDILREHICRSPPSEWLFPHPRDASKPITRGLVKYAYWCAAHKLGFGPGYEWHPHLLRSARATHKARELQKIKAPPLEAVAEIQATLRHATPTMAFEYVKESSELREEARKADAALVSRMLKALS
jgi:integrase